MLSLVPAATAASLLAAPAAEPSSLLSHLGVALGLALLPILVVAATSFVKIALVLAILRSALGAPGVPPTSVLTAFAAVLTLFIMAPVGNEMLSAIEAEPPPAAAHPPDPYGFDEARALLAAASPPLAGFLRANTPDGEIAFFNDLAGLPPAEEPAFRVLLPAFATGEIAEAFFIGFLVFLPFLVIDLVVAATLAAAGMPALSPAAVALPLKLLLFVVVDGWHLIVAGLVTNYAF